MVDREYRKVLEYVKEEIYAGRLSTGSKLPTERKMSEELQIGRGSIREALKIMNSMGLITSRQGSGNYLSGHFQEFLAESMSMMLALKQTDYEEISYLRKNLEQAACKKLLGAVTANQLMQLQRLAEDMEAEKEKVKRIQLDKTFHDKLLEFSGNHLLHTVGEAMGQLVEEAVTYSQDYMEQMGPGEQEKLYGFHKQLLEALKNGDEALAEMAVKGHYDTIAPER